MLLWILDVNCSEYSIRTNLRLLLINNNNNNNNNNNYRTVSINYSVIKKDGLNFVRLYFLNYTWYVNDLRDI